MVKKILKIFFIYSYVSLITYVTSMDLVTISKVGKENTKVRWIWLETVNNFKDYFKNAYNKK